MITTILITDGQRIRLLEVSIAHSKNKIEVEIFLEKIEKLISNYLVK